MKDDETLPARDQIYDDEQEIYRRETIKLNDKIFVFYVEKRLNTDDAIEELIKGYKINR